jgi:hypothetical protein
MTSEPEFYWGGYTESGLFLHLASTRPTVYGYPRSPCGVFLTGGAWEGAWFEGAATCLKCLNLRPEMAPQ